MNKLENILQQLQKLKENSIANFSNYKVTSIVEVNNKFFPGVNIEPYVLNLGICAERNAIFSAISNGYKKIDNIYLLTDNEDDLGTPCGACRQIIHQFLNKDGYVVVFNKKGEFKKYSSDELLINAWNFYEHN